MDRRFDVIGFIKPRGASWRDWWASRTNKLTSAILAVFLAIQSGAVNLVDLGVPEDWSRFLMSAMGIAAALGMFNLRSTTDRPLEGRAEE